MTMATASPTPGGSSHFASRRPVSKQISRTAPLRPNLNRQNALAPSAGSLHTKEYQLAADSSDDDIAPPVFNKATNRLLDGEGSILGRSSPSEYLRRSKQLKSSPVLAHHIRDGSADVLAQRTFGGSPKIENNSPYPRRVVRLSSTPGSMRKAASLQSTVQRYNDQVAARDSPITTPAVKRTVRIPINSSFRRSGTGSSSKPSSRLGSGMRSGESDQEILDDSASAAHNPGAVSHGSVTRYGATGRGRFGDGTGVLESSMRVKRPTTLGGSFLKGPARRGRRRQSEEDQEQEQRESEIHESSTNRDHPSPDTQVPEHDSEAWIPEPEIGRSSHYALQSQDYASGSPLAPPRAQPTVPNENDRPESPVPTSSIMLPNSNLAQPVRRLSPIPLPNHAIYTLPVPKAEHISAYDQENEAPPTFKRNKPTPFSLLDKVDSKPKPHDVPVRRVQVSPRPALAARSQNTPHRPAPAPPAPPKMTVLETATATAGAATTSHASKRRNAVKVNGKVFTRLDVIGRGGSSKVWRVMAENGKFLALKKVLLEDADENAVRGFKGEIDLLRKLQDNDRVVRLLDYEMNDEKQTLSVLMEMGELDFNKILVLRFNSEGSPALFDPSFTRHYWKEMLECIKSVHEQDIVHSDLKPANFVLVQGRLKLIDFGIANAIQTDETVNVHRDHQIGTPNYMAPESLIEANELPNAHGIIPEKTGRLWKVGKPSDIWSLGCILYQMAYGRQPFSHIQNAMSKCRAIIDPKYAIEYPAAGMGGAILPKSLIRTMQRCLERDQHLRPTAEDLLLTSDPFLYPVELAEGAFPMTEELLGRILQSCATKCKDKMPSDAELLKVWPAGYFASLRKNL